MDLCSSAGLDTAITAPDGPAATSTTPSRRSRRSSCSSNTWSRRTCPSSALLGCSTAPTRIVGKLGGRNPMRLLAPLLMVSLLAGCATNPRTVWVKDGGTEALFHQEQGQCQAQAFGVAGVT